MDKHSMSGADFERQTGVSRSRLNDWRIGRVPAAGTVRIVAKAFGVPVPLAFVYAGLMEHEDLEPSTQAPADPAVFSNSALLREIERRMEGAYRAAPVPPTAEEIAANPERFQVLRLPEKETPA